MARLQLKRGNFANLPTSGMLPGEPHVALDRKTSHVAVDATNLATLTPAIDLLPTLPSIAGADDFVLVHDASEVAGQKEKKMTFNDFKTALAIPDGATDEKVAAVAGGTPGFLFGTDGTDGVLRMNASMAMTLDAGHGFVTLAVGTVDGGTF